MEAPRDKNKVPTLLATSNADGTTVLPVEANPTNNSLKVDDDTTGSDLSDVPTRRDENKVPAFMAVSDVDGVTPVPVYIDSVTSGLLIDSN